MQKNYSCIAKKIQSNVLGYLRKREMCFTELEWRFLNDNHHEVSNFYGLPTKVKRWPIIT